jgi:hypothetical protein
MANRALAAVVVGLLAGTVLPVAAIDQPISGKRLVIQRTGTTEKLSFTSKDAAFLFPAVGSDDDPGIGNPGGALVEIIVVSEPTVALAVPPGTGVPGWRSTAGATHTHRWTNPSSPGGPSPVKSLRLRQGKVLTLLSRQVGLALAAPLPRVAIRVTMGNLRSCALFEGPSIRTNAAGRFVGVDAPAPALADCSDASLSGLPFCSVSGPTCGGVCPAGEECASLGANPPYRECGCLPIGSTPCTPNAPICGGACPAGPQCSPVFPPGTSGAVVDCGCTTQCPNGYAFVDDPSFPFPGCFPIACGGSYPTCGGACLDGGTCSPFAFGTGWCICAVAAPCGAGGYVCPPGQVCLPNGSCGSP